MWPDLKRIPVPYLRYDPDQKQIVSNPQHWNEERRIEGRNEEREE